MTAALEAADGMTPGGAARVEPLPPLLLGALAGAIVAGRIETAAGCAGIAALAALGARARPPAGRWIVLGVAGAALAAVMNAWLTPGRAIPGLAVFGHAPTAEGVRNAIVVVTRLLGAGLAFLGLRAVWPGERAADALASLARPLERLRVPVREARAVLGLALRFAPLLAHEWGRITRLQAMRAGRPPRGFAERMQRRRAALVPTLVGAFERADRTALALDARRYRVRPLPAPVRGGWGTAAGILVALGALLWR